MKHISIIGAGLAGSEAAWQLAERGISVTLYEMRPLRTTPAHTTADIAELVCSNSLKSESQGTSAALLKDELRLYGSLLIEMAEKARVPAGSALAVDRELFSAAVSEKILNHPHINLVREEITTIPENAIIAAGPLASAGLTDALSALTGSHLSFVDAISPVIDAASIDMNKAFFAGRYGKGGDDYLNLSMTEAEFDRFYDALMGADKVKAHGFEDEKVFEKCMPVEVMAARGRQTLLYGPMRPVGLTDPRTGKRPFAVVQLRIENKEKSAYNIVGFQTKMTIPAQKEVLRLIPGLEQAEFLRYGSIHRNTYVNAPDMLGVDQSLKARQDLYMAGQITGMEGYLESITSGLVAALQIIRKEQGGKALIFPDKTAFGALQRHITGEFGGKVYSPGNFHFGMLPMPEERIRKGAERKLFYHERGLRAARDFHQENNF